MAKNINTSHINTNNGSYISPDSLGFQGLWNVDIQQANRNGIMFLNEEAQKAMKLISSDTVIDSDWDYSYDSSTELAQIHIPFIWRLFNIQTKLESEVPLDYESNLFKMRLSIIPSNISTELFNISATMEQGAIQDEDIPFSYNLFNILATIEEEQQEEPSDTYISYTLFRLSVTIAEEEEPVDTGTAIVDLIDIGLTGNKRADQNKDTGEEFNLTNYNLSWIIRSPGGELGWFNDPIGLYIISSIYTSTAMTGRTKDYEIQIGIEGCIGFDIQQCFGNNKHITFPIPITVTPSNDDRDNTYYGTSVIEQIIGGSGTLLDEWGTDEELYWSRIESLVPEEYKTTSITFPQEILDEDAGIKVYNTGINFAYVLATVDLPQEAKYISYYFSIKKRIPIEISTKTFITTDDTDTSNTWNLIKQKALDSLLGRNMTYNQLKQALMSIITNNN